ncbi:MAG: hypothetical protein ACXAC7_18360 [Candidatus Hodarchaeales archaeon]|jgi:hypothetical protein
METIEEYLEKIKIFIYQNEGKENIIIEYRSFLHAEFEDYLSKRPPLSDRQLEETKYVQSLEEPSKMAQILLNGKEITLGYFMSSNLSQNQLKTTSLIATFMRERGIIKEELKKIIIVYFLLFGAFYYFYISGMFNEEIERLDFLFDLTYFLIIPIFVLIMTYYMNSDLKTIDLTFLLIIKGVIIFIIAIINSMIFGILLTAPLIYDKTHIIFTLWLGLFALLIWFYRKNLLEKMVFL